MTTDWAAAASTLTIPDAPPAFDLDREPNPLGDRDDADVFSPVSPAVSAPSMSNDSGQDAMYQLVIRGELDDRFGFLFEGMQMERSEGTTVLAGRVPDQARLMGLMERVDELGFELLSVQQVATSPSGPGGDQA
jgi:hypothetical protein